MQQTLDAQFQRGQEKADVALASLDFLNGPAAHRDLRVAQARLNSPMPSNPMVEGSSMFGRRKWTCDTNSKQRVRCGNERCKSARRRRAIRVAGKVARGARFIVRRSRIISRNASVIGQCSVVARKAHGIARRIAGINNEAKIERRTAGINNEAKMDRRATGVNNKAGTFSRAARVRSGGCSIRGSAGLCDWIVKCRAWRQLSYGVSQGIRSGSSGVPRRFQRRDTHTVTGQRKLLRRQRAWRV